MKATDLESQMTSHQRALPIERIERPSPDHFQREYVSRRRPVVLTGVASRWPAVTRWSPEYFRDRHGRHRVVVERSRLATPSNDPLTYLRNRYYAEEELGELIDVMLSATQPPGSYYITYSNIFERIPELHADIEPLHQTLAMPGSLPASLKARLSLRPGFWLGPAATVSPVHFDRHENFNVQITGRKAWTLFSPEDSRRLDYPALEMPSVIFSPIDVEQADARRYPLFAGARRHEVTLEPGEVLFIPAGWWHHVRTLETSISINFWWWTLAALRTTARVNSYYLLQQALKLLERNEVAPAARMPMK
ncbi:cupin-like domain-containing protein [Sorangium sp. So ce429]